ncbi:hypothetical protein GBA52_028825 [Prunus armeniaca]|nr:hypothetical protein GBA52_028825 [Prunus armeniaca]
MGKPKVVTKFQTHHKSINTYLNLLIASLRLSSNRAHTFCSHLPVATNFTLHFYHPPLGFFFNFFTGQLLPSIACLLHALPNQMGNLCACLPCKPNPRRKSHKALSPNPPPQSNTSNRWTCIRSSRKEKLDDAFDPRTSPRRRDSVPAAPAERFLPFDRSVSLRYPNSSSKKSSNALAPVAPALGSVLTDLSPPAPPSLLTSLMIWKPTILSLYMEVALVLGVGNLGGS